MLKPYMHGYFISLKLYDAARVIANPFAYAEHREKLVREKMDKLAETRIRSKKDAGVKVNKALAQKILKEAEKAQKREDRKKVKKAAAVGPEDVETEDVEMVDGEDTVEQKPTLLSDPRFAKVFENPEFAIDETSREYALLNPSSIAQRMGKTAVENEEEESDKVSSDGLESSDSEDGSSSEDSSDAGGILNCLSSLSSGWPLQFTELQPSVHQGQRTGHLDSRQRVPNVNFVPMRTRRDADDVDKNASFGQRMSHSKAGSKPRRDRSDHARQNQDGGMEITWTPSASDVHDSGGKSRAAKKPNRKGVESFGAGMERGGMDEFEGSEAQNKGRTQRRKGVRSGSKNVFRSIPWYCRCMCVYF